MQGVTATVTKPEQHLGTVRYQVQQTEEVRTCGSRVSDCVTMKLEDLVRDLRDEQASLDRVVATLTEAQWELPTPSPRWSVTDQVGHLSYFDGVAALAVRDPEAFAVEARRLMEASLQSEVSGDELTLGEFRTLDCAERLAHWRDNRQELLAAVSTLGERDRISWYGPSMGAKSFVTARLMETWAHGQDVCDTVGVQRPPSDRLRHVAQLGYITRAWSFVNRGLPAPTGDVRLELVSPSGQTWAWGDPANSGDNLVQGTALDFCLVVTQRRNIADTALDVTGAGAHAWMSLAQAFAGPPSDTRAAVHSGRRD